MNVSVRGFLFLYPAHNYTQGPAFVNAGLFFYFMDFLEEKITYIFIYNFKSHFLHTQAFSDILKLSDTSL